MLKIKHIPIQSIEHCLPGQMPQQAINPGDFFLVHGDTWISRVIQFGQSLRFRNSPFNYWTHAGLFTDTDGNIIEALGTGVTERHINYYKNEKYIIVHIYASDEDRMEAVRFAQACLNQQYGWITIASIALSLLSGLRFSFGFDGQEICSGLVARSLERTPAIFPRDPSHIMPADLASYYVVAS